MKGNSVQDILNHLILKSSELRNIGLYHGKIGIVLGFLFYSRYSDTPIYAEYAYELLDEVCSELPGVESFDFENGLSGIGWAISFMLKENFVSGEPDEILKELDEKVMGYNMTRIKDTCIRTGLSGVLAYADMRYELADKTHAARPFNPDFCSELCLQKEYYNIQKPDEQFIFSDLFSNMKVHDILLSRQLGLNNGLASILFNMARYEKYFSDK